MQKSGDEKTFSGDKRTFSGDEKIDAPKKVIKNQNLMQIKIWAVVFFSSRE